MSKQQLYWEDIEIGSALPDLVKKPTTRQLVQWAGSSGDLYEIHYDKDQALANKLPGVIVHGALKGAFLGQMLTDLVGDHGTVKKYTSSYRGMDVPGDTLTCKGKVTKKYVTGNEHIIETEMWIENGKGEKTTTGTGILVLPSKTK
ncbi:MAG: MaoC/PaaZ C-terminal domain-containing protein [Dehalococcoidales bacterium]|nr:MaoC/PaaZ C-terminal domain-containing protein [Dehalococcoidales bacterium]